MDFNTMLNWQATKPQVGQNVRKIKTRFQPQGWFGGGANAQPNQYIRFDFNTNGLWDPKSVYIYLEVDTSDMPANTIYQLDNSAQSFIGQYISRVNGVELERIQEYDEMAAYLYDMHIGLNERDAKATEGIGKNRTMAQPMVNKGCVGGYTGNAGNASSFPIKWEPGTYQLNQPNEIAQVPSGGFRPYLASQMLMGDLDIYGMTTMAFAGLEIRQYVDLHNLNDIEGHEVTKMDQASSTYTPSTEMYRYDGWAYSPTSQWGYTRPATETSVGTGEAWFSSYLPKSTIKGGIPCYERSTHGNFCVPLLSTLFGTISSHGKLLPMNIFNGLEMEFLISPYAFFGAQAATGINGFHNDSYNFSNWTFQSNFSASTFQRTGWKITKMELVVDIYYLDQQAETNYLNRVQSEGFAMDIKQWYLGPKSKFAGGDSLNQTIQINNGFNSLCCLAFYFQPADYELYPWCRKHKRISNNLTSMQLRIGNEYFPSLPIVGHAGNIRPDYISDVVKGNYVEFFVTTMQAFGKFFNMQDDTLINSSNYTSNHTGYDPVHIASGNNITQEQDVWLGNTLFFENQHVPRNIYAIDLEKLDLAGNVRSGWDTTKFRPFDLLLANDTGTMLYERGSVDPKQITVDSTTQKGIIQSTINVGFPRPYYMYTWMLYDSRITWSPSNGWSSEGRV